MAYTSWVAISDEDSESGRSELAFFGELAMVITRRENHYAWSLRADDQHGAEIRSGVTEPHASFNRADGSRDAACEAVHEAAHSLVSELEECSAGELASLKRAVPAIRSQAFTRGAERGAHAAADAMRKKAKELRAAAKALEDAAQELQESAEGIAHTCRDPYEGQP